MTSKQEIYKKKIQLQNMIILALSIAILVLIVVSSTAAWYIRTKSDTADLYFANPVDIYLTEFEKHSKDGEEFVEHTVKQDILDGFNNRIYPGDRINLQMGVKIGSNEPGKESSTAYVRVKLTVSLSKISDDPNEPEIDLDEWEDQGLLEYEDKPSEVDWIPIDFNQYNREAVIAEYGEYVPDIWYVYKQTDASNRTTAKPVDNNTDLIFVDGFIKLSKTEITNKHANHRFHINYIAEAIQIVNVPDPVANPGYGPWWNFALGDIEDI